MAPPLASRGMFFLEKKRSHTTTSSTAFVSLGPTSSTSPPPSALSLCSFSSPLYPLHHSYTTLLSNYLRFNQPLLPAMFPSFRNFLARRGSTSSTLLPDSRSKLRILSFSAVFTTTLLLFFLASPGSISSLLTLSGLQSSSTAGLGSLSLNDLDAGYSVFPSDRTFGGQDGASLTKEVQILDDECLERWIGRGESCLRESLEGKVVVDIVWTWVNGTDPQWLEQFKRYAEEANVDVPFKHFRNKSELQHSLRAALQAMRGRIRTFHLVLGDWALEGDDRKEVLWNLEFEDRGEDWRVGQIPTWLRRELVGVGTEEGVVVEVHHHSDIFRDRASGGAAWEERQFRHDTLPTFNSFAIEGNLVNIPDLAENFIYLNDEFLLTRPHTLTDWVHPLFGPIVRIAQPGTIEPATEFPPTACPHELSALTRSNFLLGHRFGAKKRAPVEHIGKLLSTPMLEEIAIIWRSDFAFSAHRRFREVERGLSDSSRVGDLHPSWLAPMFLIERARESMLWTWAVVRLGGEDGMWGDEEREEIRKMLRVREATTQKSVVIPRFDKSTRPMMDWKNLEPQMKEMGVEGPQVTEFLWSSLDGALPNGPGYYYTSCTIKLETCFGTFWNESETTSSTDAFKRLAFEHTECGDCILQALARASGPRGLSALLPATDISFSPTHHSSISQPHLPLTKLFEGTDFSLDNVVRSPKRETVDLRVWCLRLIARYQYTEGRSEFAFTQVRFRTVRSCRGAIES
ncbi:hypothetical protein BDY24DRAFT_375433 [Mrakia frigida]|uniref:uncharacterized protein n=1 Tax=Mrakia frigida TaxID=29902 RepID=UPI003FCBF497